MSTLFALSLPGLVVILIVVGVLELVWERRRRRAGDVRARPKAASAGFDALGLALAPGSRHTQEHDEFLELDRQEEGDGAPPRSRVDLDAGTARIVVRPARRDDATS